MSVFIPRLYGTTTHELYDAWVSLGTYRFNAGTGGLLRLTDMTGDQGVTTQIGFDSAKWEPRNETGDATRRATQGDNTVTTDDTLHVNNGQTAPPAPREGLVRLPEPAPAIFLGTGAAKEFEPTVARLEAEMEAARRGGFLGLLRLRYEAWLEEKMQGPAIRKMQARQAVLEQQCKTAEAEIRLKATVQSGEVGAQRHRIEWNEVNRQRLAGELQSLGMITLSPGQVPAAPAAASSAPPPVSAHVTDEQVEAVALRGFLQGVETEEDWLTYRGELARHLSPYAVEEVGSRLRDLWRLNRQSQAGA